MRTFSSALILASLVSFSKAQTTVPCTQQDRKDASPNCHWYRDCTVTTTEDGTATTYCDDSDFVTCTAETVLEDCKDSSFQCIYHDTHGGGFFCTQCDQQSECATDASPPNSQCVTEGVYPNYCTDGTCPVQYGKDFCQGSDSDQWYCYIYGDGNTGVCVAPCSQNSDCSHANGTEDGLVCQNESLASTGSANVCTVSCVEQPDICTGNQLCAQTDVQLWDSQSGSFRTQQAGTCYTGQCLQNSLDDCGTEQTCNVLLEACVSLGTCPNDDVSLCDNPLGMLCDSNELCYMCQTNSDCPEADEVCDTQSGACSIICDEDVPDYQNSTCASDKTSCVNDLCQVCSLDGVGCPGGYSCVTNNEITGKEYPGCMENQCDYATDGTDGCSGANELCTSENQCLVIDCTQDDQCPDTNVCDTQNGKCTICSEDSNCLSGYYCSQGGCFQDCTENSDCPAIQTCTVSNGKCEATTCETNEDCVDRDNTDTFYVCDGFPGVCYECGFDYRCPVDSTTEAPYGYDCSSGQPEQEAFPLGTCYISECGDNNVVTNSCNNLSQYCDPLHLCQPIQCDSQADDPEQCQTMVCGEEDQCILCENAPDGLSTNCPDGYWCYDDAEGVCTTLECSADTDCAITEICNSSKRCETQTCGTTTNSTNQNDLSCCRAQDGSPACTGSQLCIADTCSTCTPSEQNETYTSGNCVSTETNSLYCLNQEGGSMNGACVSIACDADTPCAYYQMNCDTNSQCRNGTGCDADATICRGSGTGVNGVCSSNSCVECEPTTIDGEMASNCPQPTDGASYCNTSTTETTGNYCSSPTCTDSSCNSWETCDSQGTGACAQISCTLADAQVKCPTMVCDGTACISCDATAEVTGCPAAVVDLDTYYICNATTGMCEETECDAKTTCTPGQICSNGTQVCSDVPCTDENAITACSTMSCTNSVCSACAVDNGDDDCPPSDSENDTYYVCEDTGYCKMMVDEGLSGGAIAGIIIGAVVFVIIVIALIVFLMKKDSTGEAAKLEALTTTSD